MSPGMSVRPARSIVSASGGMPGAAPSWTGRDPTALDHDGGAVEGTAQSIDHPGAGQPYRTRVGHRSAPAMSITTDRGPAR